MKLIIFTIEIPYVSLLKKKKYEREIKLSKKYIIFILNKFINSFIFLLILFGYSTFKSLFDMTKDFPINDVCWIYISG